MKILPNTDVQGTTHALTGPDGTIIARLYVEGSPAWREDCSLPLALPPAQADLVTLNRKGQDMKIIVGFILGAMVSSAIAQGTSGRADTVFTLPGNALLKPCLDHKIPFPLRRHTIEE